MSKHRSALMVLVVAAISLAVPLSAQGRSAVSSAELDAAVTTRPAGNREIVRTFLATDHAQEVASRMGVSTSQLSARVATLDPASLKPVAEQAKASDRILAGGGNIVISTTAVIIGLLILILLVD